MKKVVLAVTGGGTLAIGNLLSQGGASSWFLEGIVPYSKASLDSFIGFTPEKCCSALTARQMAMKAFKRALTLGAKPEDAIGVACTASLAKAEVEREGRIHRAFLAFQKLGATAVIEYNFNTYRGRYGEEVILASIIEQLILNMMDQDFYLKYEAGSLSESEQKLIKTEVVFDSYKLSEVLFSNKRSYEVIPFSGSDSYLANAFIFPGSFNPLHEGHANIIKKVYEQTGKRVHLEISVNNVDKAPLDYIDIKNRLVSIHDYGVKDGALANALAGVIISNTAKFYDKIWMYPRSTYIVGTDTVNRMFDDKYGNIIELIELIKTTDSNFLVAPRKGYRLNIAPEYQFVHWYIENKFTDLDVEPSELSSRKIRESENVCSGFGD